ncbi:hypothetical protein WMY93_014372 [Mugilogobius chulae]|uniref:Uncharacterized protein n=1 Tax=Mugilogobius chulae TaxID=88201 RepID=A0AAW0P492_9GOBI
MWAAPRLCSLRATYLPGDRNHIADFLSRRKPLPGEWRLHPEVVRTIWHQYGMAEVDLFATRDTSHCPHWFSLLETTGSLGQDAFAHPWPRTLLYAFPPLPLIMPTLQRIFQEGHRVLLVAPFWPSQPWFPLLHRLCHSHPWRLPAREDLLSQFGGRIWHPQSPEVSAVGLASGGPDQILTGVSGSVRKTILNARARSTRDQGARRLRPPMVQQAPAWDLPLVLAALCQPPFEPLGRADLRFPPCTMVSSSNQTCPSSKVLQLLMSDQAEQEDLEMNPAAI